MPPRSPLSVLSHLALLLLFTVAGTIASAQSPSQTFPQPTVIPTGSWPLNVTTIDFDNDGHADLLWSDDPATTPYPSVHLLYGDGHGGFSSRSFLGSAIAQAYTASSVAIGDFTNSGALELAAAFGLAQSGPVFAQSCPTFRIALILDAYAGPNPGAYSGAACVTGPRQPVLTNPIAAKLHDGHAPEVVFTDTANNLLYVVDLTYFATTTGSVPLGPLYTITTLPLPNGGGPVTAVDLNNDGHLDLVVNGLTGQTADVFLGNGTGTVTPVPAPNAGAGGIHSLLLKDVNLDGRPDLIAEGPNGRLDVFFGNGDGTFQTTSSGGTGTLDGRTGNGGHLITLADLNHDGQLDALTSTPAGISALLGQGTAYLGLKGISNAGPGMHSFATADFNGDGNLDLATDSPEGIAVLYGNPDGTFQTSAAYAAGQPALSGATGALTSSGHPDVVVSTGATQAQTLLGGGDGTFTPVGGADSPQPTSPNNGNAGLWSSVLLGDWNGDGRIDLAVIADGASTGVAGGTMPPPGVGLIYQLGQGNGTFAPAVNFDGSMNGQPAFYYGTAVTIPDFQQNSQTYLATLTEYGGVVTNLDQYPSPADLYTDQLTNPHAHNLTAAGALRPATTALSDIVDQDEGSLRVLLNQFGVRGKGAIQYLGDLAVDGSLTTPGQLVAPDISATFPGSSQALGFRAFPGSMKIADLDRDGNGDLLVVYANLDANRAAPAVSAPNYLYIWFGSGGGKFLTSAVHPVNPVRIQLSRNYYQVAVADLNHDGIPDLILSDGYLVSVQNGLGSGTFGPETHLLAGQGINSLLLADVNGDGTLDLITANGGAVLSNPVANLEVLATNPDVNTGGITVLLNPIPKTALTATLTVTPNPVAFEAGYTATATLTPPPGGAAPGGSVTFTLPNLTGTAPVQNGTATFAIPAYSVAGTTPLLPGTYTVTATYSGDTSYAALNNLTTTLTVNLAPTTVTLTPTTPLQTQYGGPVNGTFAVQVVDGNYPATGTYTVYDNGVAVRICTKLPLTVNGVPYNCPYGDPVLLNAGPHALTVGYNGDAVNAPSISAAAPYFIAPDPTATTIVSSLNPALLGQNIVFTASVSGTLAVPTGSVTFVIDNALAPQTPVVLTGTGQLNAQGVATFAVNASTLGAGTFFVVAEYAGNQNFSAAPTAVLTEIISAPPVVPAQFTSAVTLTSSVNPAAPAQPIILTATVTVGGPYAPVLTGTVTFLDGATPLTTLPVPASGIVPFTIATLTPGVHALTAAYSGATGLTPVIPPGPAQPPANPRVPRSPGPPAGATDTILPSVSPLLSEVVDIAIRPEPIGFTINVTPVPITLGVGRSAVLLVQVTPVSGFAQPVTLSCGSLPYEATCTFANATIPTGGGATTLTLTTQAPHDCGNPSAPYFLGEASPVAGLKTFAALFLPGLLALGLLRRRRHRALLKNLLRDLAILTLTCAGIASISGCGHCTDLGTQAGTYTFTVNGTAVGTPVTQTQSQSVQLTTHY